MIHNFEENFENEQHLDISNLPIKKAIGLCGSHNAYCSTFYTFFNISGLSFFSLNDNT